MATLTACTAAAREDPLGRVPGSSSPEAPSAESPARPFDLEVARITVVGMDNAAILGTRSSPSNTDVAEDAVAAARDVLAAFLNSQFIAEDTRFSAAPIDTMLSARALDALTAEDRAGLGQVTLPVDRTVTGPASTVAQVLMDGDQAHAVTLSHNVLFTVVLEDGSESSVKQSGTITFVPSAEGWRADAVEVVTDLPEVTS